MVNRILAFTVLLALTACAAKDKAPAIPENFTEATLQAVLQEPGKYDGKNVLLKGTVEAVCPSGCDMVYREGQTTYTVFPKGFKIGKMKKGTPVALKAEVIKGRERVVISVYRVEVLK